MQRRFLLVLSLFVTVTALWAAPERLPIGEFTAPKLATPPTIDGVVAEGEWDVALMTSGMMTPFDQSLQEAATTVAFGWDEQRFYFLFVCVRGDREWKLWKSVRENDDYNFGDPSIEIWVTPPSLVPETYQSVINTYPAVLDMKMIPSRGYTAQGWRGNWELGVTESDTQYILEASIPVSDFDGYTTVKSGDAWRFLLCRTSPGTQSRSQASWSLTQGFAELIQHPVVRLVAEAPAIQVRDVTSVLSGHYRFPIAVAVPTSPKAAPETVELELVFHQGASPAADDAVQRQSVQVMPGTRKEAVFEGDLPQGQKGNFTIRAVHGGQAIFSQTFPYQVNGWVPKAPTRPEKAETAKPLSVSAMYGPENNVVILRADIIDLPEREQAVGGTIRILDAGNQRALLTEPLASFRHWYSSNHFSLDALRNIPVVDHQKIAYLEAQNRDREAQNKQRAKKGQEPLALHDLTPPEPLKLLVEVAVVDAAGNVLKVETADLAVRRYKFPWSNNQVGITEKVIPPWTPVAVRGAEVGVWNRNLRMNGLGLLDGLDNGGTSQIRRMRLVAVVDGREVAIAASAPSLVRQVEAEAVLRGTGSGAGLSLAAETKVEFDGFVLSSLTIGPEGAAPTKIDRLYWELVMPEEEATHFCATAGGWTAVMSATPPRWSSQQTASGMLIGDFVPYIWLTNSDRAFLWFADNDKGWITDDDKSLPTQEIVREKGTVTLRVNFIEVPTELAAPTTLSYGYQAFPSRPLPDGWRGIICANTRSDYPSATNTYFWFDGDWAVLWPYYCSPYPWSMEKSKALFDRYPVNSDHRPAVGSIAHSIGRYRDYDGRTFDEFVVDWGETPGDRSNANITQSRGPTDFRLYHYERWVREAGFRALYIDENYLALEKNFLTGGAYYRPDGRLQPGYSYLGLREYFKRMTIMFHQNRVPTPNLWQHITGGAAYHAWFGNVFFEGENVEPTNELYDYMEVLPAERMRAIGSSVCAGGAMSMMCQAQRHSTPFTAKHVHQFIGWVMAHDILPEQVREWNMLAQEARLYRADCAFLPYWKASTPVKTETAGCLVSAHRTDGRAILWVVNTERQDRDVEVKIDWGKLGLDRGKTVAFDIETGAPIEAGRGGFTVKVLQRDFVGVMLVERRVLKDGETFAASFDQGLEADEALGSSVLVGATALTEGVSGKAALIGNGITLWPHLHLRNDRGSLRFSALLGTGAGSILTAGKLNLLSVNAKELVFGEVKAARPAAGWHTFDLTWADGKTTLSVDGQPVGTIDTPAFGFAEAGGKELVNGTMLTFGDRRGAVTAIDDILCRH